MKLRLLVGLVVGLGVSWGQGNNVPNQLILGAEGPQGVKTVNARIIGNGGNNLFYYWVIPNYNAGQGPATSVVVRNAPNVLSVSNYVQITWTPIDQANSYAVLRTLTPTLPNPCTGCLVVNPQVTPLVNDQGAVLGGYSFSQVGPATAHITLDNISYIIPRILIDRPINPTLFVNLPSAASAREQIWIVKDAITSNSCVAGGGTNTPAICWSNGTNWFAIGGGGSGLTTNITCSGDITASLNGAISTLTTGSGGTIILSNGSCFVTALNTIPNDGANPPKQKYLHIVGQGGNTNGYWGTPLVSGTTLDLQENNLVGKIDTRGAGTLEIDHIRLIDSGVDCAAFISTTNTQLQIHDVTFSGTASSNGACNDAIVMGGTTTTIDGTATAPFQGYGSVIERNFFDKIRRGVYGRVFFNGVVIQNNTWSTTSGSNLTTAITAASNAAAAILTVVGHGFQVGTVYSMLISGATGSWVPINGIHAVTPLTANTFSIPVNSGAFGALTGSPVFYSGGAIELDGTGGGGAPGQSTTGNFISGNLVEMVNYPFFVKTIEGIQNTFSANNLYDADGTTVAYFGFYSSSQYSLIGHGFANDTSALVAFDTTSNENSIVTAHQSQMSLWGQPWTFSNTVTMNSSLTGTSSNALIWGGTAGFTGLITASGGVKVAAGQTYATTGRGDFFFSGDGVVTWRDSSFAGWSYMNFGGATAATPRLFFIGPAIGIRTSADTIPTVSALPNCQATSEGAMSPVSDSDTQVWGANVIHTVGVLHALAYCDGTNWTVMGK